MKTMELSEFIPLRPHSKANTKMASVAISAGDPCEIINEIEQIDFNEYLTNGNDGVYLITAVGDSMEAEIFHGDILIVNRNLQARNGDKIIASVNDSFTVKIFSDSTGGLRLIALNGKYQPRNICHNDNFEIFGVVTHIVRSLKRN